MKGVNWGNLYNKYKDQVYDAKQIEKQTAILIIDDDVENKKGIYPYLLTGDERYLGLRAFSDAIKQKVYEKQKGICPVCKEHYDISQMEGDHITPWKENGKTVEANCQMLCRDDNRRKGTK